METGSESKLAFGAVLDLPSGSLLHHSFEVSQFFLGLGLEIGSGLISGLDHGLLGLDKLFHLSQLLGIRSSSLFNPVFKSVSLLLVLELPQIIVVFLKLLNFLLHGSVQLLGSRSEKTVFSVPSLFVLFDGLFEVCFSQFFVSFFLFSEFLDSIFSSFFKSIDLIPLFSEFIEISFFGVLKFFDHISIILIFAGTSSALLGCSFLKSLFEIPVHLVLHFLQEEHLLLLLSSLELFMLLFSSLNIVFMGS